MQFIVSFVAISDQQLHMVIQHSQIQLSQTFATSDEVLDEGFLCVIADKARSLRDKILSVVSDMLCMYISLHL